MDIKRLAVKENVKREFWLYWKQVFSKVLQTNFEDLMKKLALYTGLIILSGCATPTTMSATRGSKADGIVEMSFEYGEFQQPVIDPDQGMEAAIKRCKAWGYSKAEPFDGGINTCVLPGGFGGCFRMRTTISYQCIR